MNIENKQVQNIEVFDQNATCCSHEIYKTRHLKILTRIIGLDHKPNLSKSNMMNMTEMGKKPREQDTTKQCN